MNEYEILVTELNEGGQNVTLRHRNVGKMLASMFIVDSRMHCVIVVSHNSLAIHRVREANIERLLTASLGH